MMQTLAAGRIAPTRDTAEAIRTDDADATIGKMVAEFLRRAVAAWDDESDMGETAPTPHQERIDWRIVLCGLQTTCGTLDAFSYVAAAIDDNTGTARAEGRYVCGEYRLSVVPALVVAVVVEHPDGWNHSAVMVRVAGTIEAELV
jgi:hypothetical protein